MNSGILIFSCRHLWRLWLKIKKKGEGIPLQYITKKGIPYAMGKKKEKEVHGLRCELKHYEQQGISLWLNGKKSSPKEIAKAHKVAEDGIYMRDYVQNEKGEVEKIQFDLIKHDTTKQ